MPRAASQIELIHGDFLAESPKRLRDASVDVVMTSPPYNLGIEYNSYNDRLPEEEYLKWTRHWSVEVERVLDAEGSVFVNVGTRPSEPWRAWDVASVFRERFALQNVIHWVKSISIEKRDVGNYPGVTRDITIGHYKPINSSRFLNDAQEYIFHFTKGGRVPLDRLAIGVPYQDSSNVKRWQSAGGGLHCRGNTWFIPYPTIKFRSKDRPHPATFPPRLPEMCMRLHGVERIRTVMDPFSGLGSTGVAARKLGLKYVGFEIDAVYLDWSRERITGGHENGARASRKPSPRRGKPSGDGNKTVRKRS